MILLRRWQIAATWIYRDKFLDSKACSPRQFWNTLTDADKLACKECVSEIMTGTDGVTTCNVSSPEPVSPLPS
jgi:hypothetical protein